MALIIGSDANGRVQVDHNRNVNTNTNTGGSSNGLHSGTSTTVNVQQRTGGSNGGSSAQVQQRASGSSGSGPSYSYADYAAQRAAAQAELDRQAAEEEARRRAEEERLRNEQLRRQNDERIRQNAREYQALRNASNGQPTAAMLSGYLNDHIDDLNAYARDSSDRIAPRVTSLSADEVANSDQALESQPATQAENLGLVDTDTGEVINTTPERANVPSGVREAGRPGRPPVSDEMSPSEIAAMVDAATPEVVYSDRKHMGREAPVHMGETARRGRHFIPAEDVVESAQMYSKEMADEAEIDDGTVGLGLPADVSTFNPNDVAWRGDTDITGLTGERAQLRRIRENETSRVSDRYNAVREEGGQEGTDFDAQDKGYTDGYDFDARDSESYVRRVLRNARNDIYKRFLNPSLLRIESEHVETTTRKVNGKDRTYGRIRYSKDVEGAISAVRNMYHCSIYNVMQLVQLRGGIGVDSNGKIAKVDPNEFRLTDDQFIELCRDICESQRTNGHPLGAVQGKPGGSGVRDDTGRFVVVAKTRCFPLGYIPEQLVRDLRRGWGSHLHNMSERQIAQMVGEEWINNTYPQLCANTGGNLMYQARAIENMMRGLMMVDGKNPSDLDIPEIVERQTLMALRAETAATNDPDIKVANEIKQRNIEDIMSRWKHRWFKENGSRSRNGDLQSASMKRRRNEIGDSLRGNSRLQMAAKAANIGVMISSIPEGIVANRTQALANVLSDAVFNNMHGELAQSYKMTGDLETLSQTKEAIEARDVAESLYRIGGHDAIDAFLNELGDDGRARNRLTRTDFYRFLQESGVTGPNAGVSDKVRQMFNIKPGEEAGFLSNVGRIVNGLENLMLSSNMFKESESRQFVQMSMAEMARSALHGRESYTSQQVADWGLGQGGEAMVRSLLQTDAGREAFMTQGITSLGRKSPVEHQLRLIMAKNGLTEFAVRTMFDRFPEYGVNKVLQMIPFSNTLSYLSAYGVKNVGDILVTANEDTAGGRALVNAGEAMQRNLSYQAGSRTSFAEGLRKNLMYDTIMGGEKLLIAGLYCGVIMFLGGLQPPDDDKDKYTWSEWKIGDGENAVPIKWAWWMDDLSGIGLPLGLAWAICETGGWSDESKRTATNTFINAVANFNSGTALFDAIDLVNNFDEEWAAATGKNVQGYDPEYDEWLSTMFEQGFWDLVGDMTPTFIGQLVPWSKDYILAGDRDAHTASRIYDVGEGSKYSMEEAQSDYRTKQIDSYSDYMRRRSAQTNVLQAMFYDWFYDTGADDSAITGYKYTEQPLDTMVDPYVQAMYDRFYLDLDPRTSNIPIDNQEDREAELYARADVVCQWIDQHYQNAMQANLDGFVLNYDARVNCINYCYKKIDEAWDRYNEATSNGWLPDDQYDAVVQERQNAIDHYKDLIYNYFQSEDIPWSLPRYVRQESDTETRYVDANGNAATFLDTLGGAATAQAEKYWYGNRPSMLPFTSPRTTSKGYNYETIPYWAVTDEDGNPVGPVEQAYDNAGSLVGGQGRNENLNIRELMWGGQGNNIGVQLDENGNPVLDTEGNVIPTPVDEELRIARGGVPTIGSRPWRAMTETFPESLKSLDADTVSKLLGIPSSLPTDDDESKEDTTDNKPTNGNRSYSYGSGGRSYYSGGGYYYGGGGSSSYNPKIYSTSKQVYSKNAAGMSTRQPYKATTTYLRPAFYTKGSRTAYRRQQ